MYYQSRADMMPWLKAGRWALGRPSKDPLTSKQLKGLRKERRGLRKELKGLGKGPGGPDPWRFGYRPYGDVQSTPKNKIRLRKEDIEDKKPRIMAPASVGTDPDTGRIDPPERGKGPGYPDPVGFKPGDQPGFMDQPPSENDREAELRDRIRQLDRKIRVGKTGRKATGLVGMIEKGPGEFVPEEQPGYQYGYEEFIEKPMMRGAAARGRFFSPGTTDELGRKAQDYASMSYDNYLSRYYNSLRPYQSLAGVGQTAAQTMGGWGQNVGSNIGRNYLYAGQQQGYGEYGKANAWMAGISGLSNILTDYYAKKNIPAIK
jgi:hypothetical protein